MKLKDLLKFKNIKQKKIALCLKITASCISKKIRKNDFNLYELAELRKNKILDLKDIEILTN